MSSISVSFTLAQTLMVQYCHSTILILGIIGSVINILLFSRAYLRSNPCCIYFLGSSLNGIILLSIGIIPQLYSLYNSPNPFTTIRSFCKARTYLNQTSAMSCRWLLILACIDRCLSCSTNPRIRRFSSVNIARKMVILTMSIWLILPIHTLIYSDIQPPLYSSCTISNNDIAIYHRIYTILMGGAIPTIVSFLCSLFIWKHFQERRKTRLIRVVSNDIERKKKIRDQQVLFMLLIQVAIFLISTIPFMSFNIYDTMTRVGINKSQDRKSIEAFVKTLTELLVYLITMSFYSNTLVSRTFRKELITLVIYRGRRQHRKINPSLITKTNTMQITNKPMKSAMPIVR